MARFEEALAHILNGGRARRACWAEVADYTRTTPPIKYFRRWHIWQEPDVGGLINGWGGSVGGAAENDPVRNGMGYSPTDDDRVAADWELMSS